MELFFFLALALVVLAIVIAEKRSWNESRRHFEAAEQRRRVADREAERLADGLPPHERCLCAKCRAWRTNPGNADLLRLRGLSR